MASAGWGALGSGPTSNGAGAWNASPSPQPTYEGPIPLPDGPPVPPPAPKAQGSSFFAAFQPKSSTSAAAKPPSAAPQSLAEREAALNQRAAALAERERALQALQRDMEAQGTYKRKNWPFKFLPIIYHDIAEEIPEGSRRVVREMYMCWFGLVWCLLWNFICASIILGTDAKDKVSSWFLTIIYAITGIPIAFYMWYLAIYRAAKNDSAARYLFFFISFIIHIGFCIWAAIAFQFSAEYWSFAGWIAAFSAFDHSSGAGVCYIIGACCWSVEAAYSFWCLKDAYFFFRGAGGIEQARNEAALAAFRQNMGRT